jgi:hypothetical protein
MKHGRQKISTTDNCVASRLSPEHGLIDCDCCPFITTFVLPFKYTHYIKWITLFYNMYHFTSLLQSSDEIFYEMI